MQLPSSKPTNEAEYNEYVLICRVCYWLEAENFNRLERLRQAAFRGHRRPSAALIRDWVRSAVIAGQIVRKWQSLQKP